ncbi:hypothetical protein CDAR_50711 [Caerostris darwini]|uniref:Uncharacterized protein n=1 Tax=Caerostris darwini TaxID=1538125 RepID=A0AAV4UWY7_9ARAC|nr:hypothetical protein CDAR_50711 [Caerostris darwini]
MVLNQRRSSDEMGSKPEACRMVSTRQFGGLPLECSCFSITEMVSWLGIGVKRCHKQLNEQKPFRGISDNLTNGLQTNAPLAWASGGAQLSPNAFNEVGSAARGRSKTPDLPASIRDTLHCYLETIRVTIDGAPAALSIGWGRKWEMRGQLIIRTLIAPPTPLPRELQINSRRN